MEPVRRQFDQERIYSLQALRAAAALFIVSEHVLFLRRGAFGVDIFFVLSGLFAMQSTARSGMRGFFIKRLIRILPLYLAATVLLYAAYRIYPQGFASFEIGVGELLMSLGMIPFESGDGAILPILKIGWTVQCELFFYLLFFLAGRINARRRGQICAGFLTFFVVLAAVLHNRCPVWLQFYGNPVMLEFLFGFGLYALLKRLHEKEIPRAVSVCAAFAALAVFALLAATQDAVYKSGVLRPLLWGSAAVAVTVAFYLYGRNLTVPKALVFLGDVSYSVYLIHYFIVRVAGAVFFDFSTATAASVAGVFAVYLLTVAAAWASRNLVEVKFGGWLKKIFL